MDALEAVQVTEVEQRSAAPVRRACNPTVAPNSSWSKLVTAIDGGC